MSSPLPSPSSLEEASPPHTPSSRPALLQAHASPLFNSDTDTDPEGTEPIPIFTEIVQSDVPFDQIAEDDDEMPVELVELPETPAISTIGRTGFRRETVLQKASIIHKYGARCMVTLGSASVQIAHVLPVGGSDQLPKRMERVLGDKPGTLNKHSSRNIWILEPTIHSAIDRGHIKLVPSKQVFTQMQTFINHISCVRIRRLEKDNGVLIEKAREVRPWVQNFARDPEWDQVANDPDRNAQREKLDHDIEEATRDKSALRRVKALPPAWYPYLIIGITCAKDFPIYRQILNVEDPPQIVTTDNGKRLCADQQPFDFPIKVSPSLLEKPKLGDFGKLDSMPLLRGIEGMKTAPRIIDPLKYEESNNLLLAQDPFLVAANAGEFLYVMRERMQQQGKLFDIRNLVVDETHREHLDLALEFYTLLKHDDENILAVEKQLQEEGKSSKSMATGSKSRTSAHSRHNYGTRSNRHNADIPLLMGHSGSHTGSQASSDIRKHLRRDNAATLSEPSVDQRSIAGRSQKRKRTGSNKAGPSE
ncbi:hypothetical protein L218DRAFT_1007483 [Marasmius fiardii PR-910]|nr:hypothetical protein L218DRAFT_1007483 [Marasmius fiardii PR-910]